VAFVKEGMGSIKVNGAPITLLEPEILRLKTLEPILLFSNEKLKDIDILNTIDIRVRVKGGGTTSQIYAIRQAIAKGIVAYAQKFNDEATKKVRFVDQTT
jgi:small subunit ribosomal protein S16e